MLFVRGFKGRGGCFVHRFLRLDVVRLNHLGPVEAVPRAAIFRVEFVRTRVVFRRVVEIGTPARVVGAVTGAMGAIRLVGVGTFLQADGVASAIGYRISQQTRRMKIAGETIREVQKLTYSNLQVSGSPRRRRAIEAPTL